MSFQPCGSRGACPSRRRVGQTPLQGPDPGQASVHLGPKPEEWKPSWTCYWLAVCACFKRKIRPSNLLPFSNLPFSNLLPLCPSQIFCFCLAPPIRYAVLHYRRVYLVKAAHQVKEYRCRFLVGQVRGLGWGYRCRFPVGQVRGLGWGYRCRRPTWGTEGGWC